MNYPETLEKVIDSFKILPGVGEKSAERYAFALLGLDDDKIDIFSNSLKELKQNVTTCPICGCLSEKNKCSICDSEGRNDKILCVVENQKNVFLFERTGYFNGKYHVLGGLISPMDGINPEDISIDSLIKRIEGKKIEEVILALRPGIEGNTTALYITRLLEKYNVKVTKIAQGIPIGADMEYLDALTLEMALENRSEVS